MGELLGIPEWLAMTLLVVLGVALWLTIGSAVWKRKVRQTAARRPNLSQDAFMTAMSPDTSPQAAAFLWQTILDYVAPELTPHPDDILGKDLPIDDDDWSMDWPVAFARQQGFHESNLPEWPENWAATIRNYGRWLSMAPTVK